MGAGATVTTTHQAQAGERAEGERVAVSLDGTGLMPRQGVRGEQVAGEAHEGGHERPPALDVDTLGLPEDGHEELRRVPGARGELLGVE